MDDSYLIAAIKLLHSSAQDSAEKMRNMLNTEILKNYDKTKLVENNLSKKQVESLISQETKAVGSGFKLKKHKTKKIEELKLATTSLMSENQQIIKTDDPADDSSDNESSSAMDLLTDLTCVLCRQMDNSANNQLFECIECHQLWHQLCHPTKIQNDVNQNSWTCSACCKEKDPVNKECKEKDKKKEGSSKSTKSYESSSSSSSSSYKEKVEIKKEKEKEIVKKEKPKEKSEKRKSDSSSKSTKKSKESSSSSSSRSRSSKKSS